MRINHVNPAKVLRGGTLVAAALLLAASLAASAWAGSTTSNLPAMMKVATAARTELKTAAGQFEGLLAKLGSDKALAASYDAAMAKGDLAALAKVLAEGGIKGEMPLRKAGEPVCWKMICTDLPTKAAEAAEWKGAFPKHAAAVDAFLAKIVSDRAYAMKLEAAALKGDKAGAQSLVVEGGLAATMLHDISIGKDVKIDIHWDWIHIHIEW